MVHHIVHHLVQAALDAALFEPGLWQAEPHKRLPRQIPGPDRAHLATPAGMLFNELVMSPHAVTEPVLKLVVLAMELDSGKYSAGSANCSALLYVLRVAVRVEGFVRAVLAAHDAQEAAASGAGRPGDCPPRGLGARPKELANLRACAVRLRGALQHDLHPVVEQARCAHIRCTSCTTSCTTWCIISHRHRASLDASHSASYGAARGAAHCLDLPTRWPRSGATRR